MLCTTLVHIYIIENMLCKAHIYIIFSLSDYPVVCAKCTQGCIFTIYL